MFAKLFLVVQQLDSSANKVVMILCMIILFHWSCHNTGAVLNFSENWYFL